MTAGSSVERSEALTSTSVTEMNDHVTEGVKQPQSEPKCLHPKQHLQCAKGQACWKETRVSILFSTRGMQASITRPRI